MWMNEQTNGAVHAISRHIKILFFPTFQLNVAEIDVEVADVAFEAELVAVGAGDRVLSECLYVDYFLNYLVAMTSLPIGI